MRRATLSLDRPHKYGAKATEVDGIRFASQKEARRYQELKLLEKAGEIHGLIVQPAFALASFHTDQRLVPTTLGIYRADFQYCTCNHSWICANSEVVIEDVKGFKTPLYKWKKKHVEAQYGITIREI